LKIIFGSRGQKDHFGDPFPRRVFEELLDKLIADPLALILGENGGGTKKPYLSMTFQADTPKDLAPAAARDQKAAEVFFHPVVWEVYLRKNLKNVVQTSEGRLLDGDKLSIHVIL